MASKDSEVIPESCESRDVFCIHTATVSLPFPLRHLPRVCRGFGNSVNPRHTSLPQPRYLLHTIPVHTHSLQILSQRTAS